MASALLFSDLHCSNKQLSNLCELIAQNDKIQALIFAGDAVNMGEPVWFMEAFIKAIDKIGLPFFWVPGNNDFGRAYYKLNAKYKSLEGRVAEFEGRTFTGVGGSPASWAGQYAGENMIDRTKIGDSIFVSHVPPPGILTLQQKDLPSPILKSSKHEAPNSKQILNYNDKNSKHFSGFDIRISDLPKRRFGDAPLVHICGHLHYRWGTAYLGRTKVIQLASLETGHYAIMDLETLAVEFKRFRMNRKFNIEEDV